MSPSQRRLTVAQESAPEPYKVADPADVTALAQQLSENFILCRDFGHTWKISSVVRTGRSGFDRNLFCPRCKTNRTQKLGLSGDVLDSSYQYQEGYQFKGMGRMLADGRAALRMESLARYDSSKGILDHYPDEEDVTPIANKRKGA
jgi:hypothetical protein